MLEMIGVEIVEKGVQSYNVCGNEYKVAWAFEGQTGGISKIKMHVSYKLRILLQDICLRETHVQACLL